MGVSCFEFVKNLNPIKNIYSKEVEKEIYIFLSGFGNFENFNKRGLTNYLAWFCVESLALELAEEEI